MKVCEVCKCARCRSKVWGTTVFRVAVWTYIIADIIRAVWS